MKGWVKGLIAGIIIAVIGIAVLLVGLAINNWKFASAMPEFKTLTYSEEKENSSVKVEVNAGRVKTEFYDGDKIQIDFPVAEKYNPEISEENGTLIYKSPTVKWYNYWGWSHSKVPYTVIRLPKDHIFNKADIYNIEIEVNAGTVEITQGKYDNVKIEVNAGAVTTGAITCNKFDCEINAGAMNVESLICNVSKFEVNAGAGNFKKVSCGDITADVSAGALKMKLDGVRAEYNITAIKSAGSCNVVNQNGTTDKKLKVGVSAGSADITFTN